MGERPRPKPYDDPNPTGAVIRRLKDRTTITGLQTIPLSPDAPSSLLSQYILAEGNDPTPADGISARFKRAPYDVSVVSVYQESSDASQGGNEPTFVTRRELIVSGTHMNVYEALQRGHTFVTEQALIVRFREELDAGMPTFTGEPQYHEANVHRPAHNPQVSPFAKKIAKDLARKAETVEPQVDLEAELYAGQAATVLELYEAKYADPLHHGEPLSNADINRLPRDISLAQTQWKKEIQLKTQAYLEKKQDATVQDIIDAEDHATRVVLEKLSILVDREVTNTEEMGMELVLGQLIDPQGINQRALELANIEAGTEDRLAVDVIIDRLTQTFLRNQGVEVKQKDNKPDLEAHKKDREQMEALVKEAQTDLEAWIETKYQDVLAGLGEEPDAWDKEYARTQAVAYVTDIVAVVADVDIVAPGQLGAHYVLAQQQDPWGFTTRLYKRAQEDPDIDANDALDSFVEHEIAAIKAEGIDPFEPVFEGVADVTTEFVFDDMAGDGEFTLEVEGEEEIVSQEEHRTPKRNRDEIE